MTPPPSPPQGAPEPAGPAAPQVAAPSDLRLVVRLLPYLTQQGWRLWLALVLYPMGAACVVAPPYLVQQIFDQVVTNGRGGRLLPLAVIYALAVALEWVTGFAAEYNLSILGQRAMANLRGDLFARLQAQDQRYFDTTPQGRILTRLTNDVEALSELFSTGAITLISDALTLVSVVGMMLYLSPALTLLSFLVLPPMALISWVCQRFARDAFRRIRRHLAGINSFLAEHIGHMSVVQTLGQEVRVNREFAELGEAYRAANRQAIFFDAALFALVEAIGTASIAALIGWGSGSITQGALTAGVLVAFIQYIRRFFIPLRDLTTKFTVLQSALAAAERVVASLETPARLVSPDNGYRPATGVLTDKPNGGVRLEGVWFGYGVAPAPAKTDAVLRGIDLHVGVGEKVALVGATGSGKSTILRLLGRSYDVQAGVVRVDGEDVRTWDLLALRRLFGVVLQDTHLFSGTLRDNLALWPGTTDATLMSAIEALGADGWLMALPGGLDAPVSESGHNFSAGQKQLLAMIRALAIDPQILLLDEATSNIDSATESRLQAALEVLMAKRTTIVVAHRLSTVEKMDRIIVLSQGTVAQEGSHAILMQNDGPYRRQVHLSRPQDALPGNE